jgi:tetratricopeptide (TPR) repeat protein
MIARRALRTALWAAAVGGLATAAAWSVRLARADAWFQTETVAGTEKALSLTPGQAAYGVRLALLIGDDDPGKAAAALRQALVSNPHDARAWIELGLRYEADGNLPLAERTLLHAAEESRVFLPAWTLMNYYFRRDDAERFWFWARSAVPMMWGDPLPLFHLCGRVKEDGDLIGRLDIRKPEMQTAYLFYLLDVGRPDLAGPTSRRLMRSNRKADVPLLLDACDRLLAAKRTGDALAIWDGLVAAHRIPGGGARGGRGGLLYNGDFAASPTGHGFDWRLPAIEGISAAQEENPVGLRLAFSGAQPEDAEPLVQLAPVDENGAYVLAFGYRTSGIAAGTGLYWRVGDANRGDIIVSGESLASDDPTGNRIAFVAPPGCHLVRVALAYRRRPGTTRISGFIVLRDVELRRAAQPPSDDPPRSRVMK